MTASIALRMFVAMTVLTGLIYPLLITVVSYLVMPKQANGSLLFKENRVMGSALIAQNFNGEGYFWPRPSAVDYDPIKPAGGSNYGPTSKNLYDFVRARVKELGSDAPADLVYASGSGLDPHISLKAAHFQMERIVKTRSISDPEVLRSFVDSFAEGFSPHYVNVFLMNNALDEHFPLKKL